MKGQAVRKQLTLDSENTWYRVLVSPDYTNNRNINQDSVVIKVSMQFLIDTQCEIKKKQ